MSEEKELMDKLEHGRECQNCAQDIGDTDHLVEAFETTGKIICDDCWNGFLMDNQE